MKIIFAHDHNFIYSSGTYYSNGSFGLDALERYTKVFGSLTVLSRQVQKRIVDNTLTVSSGENIEFVKIPNLNGLIGLKNYKMASEIIENQVKSADYVIARLPSFIGNLAIKYAKRNQIPYLVELVGCTWDALKNHSIKSRFIAPFNYFITKKKVANANYVIYVTSNFLQTRYPTNGKATNCSNVSLNEFDNKVLKKRLIKINKLSKSSKITIGTIGATNVKYKGQQYIIESLGELKKNGFINFEYQIVGNGDNSFLKSIAKKNKVEKQVKFLGSKPHGEIFNWLDKIDVYTQPSTTEGLPRAVIEAMSRGLPIFSSNAGGIPELLDEKYIYKNSRNRKKAICEMILSFDKDEMKKQALRNYEESKKYDKTIIENRRSEFFEKFKNYE